MASESNRVLIEVLTVANLEGVAKAQKSFMGLSLATAGLAIGLYAVVKVGESAIENAKSQEEAFNQLAQAYATQHDTLEAHREEILNFIETNKAFISDQYDTEKALAAAVRAGHSQADAMRILGDALDYVAVRGGTATEGVDALNRVLAGNQKALKVLGITTEEYNAIMHDKTIPLEERQAKLLDLIETKTRGGRNTIDSLAQSQNTLNKAWQDFTSKIGPPLIVAWGKLNEAAATGVGILSVYVDLLEKIWKLEGQALAGNPAAKSHMPIGPTRGPQIASSGGGGKPEIHVHVDRGAFIDGPSIDTLAIRVAQRLRMTSGI